MMIMIMIISLKGIVKLRTRWFFGVVSFSKSGQTGQISEVMFWYFGTCLLTFLNAL